MLVSLIAMCHRRNQFFFSFFLFLTHLKIFLFLYKKIYVNDNNHHHHLFIFTTVLLLCCCCCDGSLALLHDSKVDFNYRPNLQSGAKWVSLTIWIWTEEKWKKIVSVASLHYSFHIERKKNKCFTNPNRQVCGVGASLVLSLHGWGKVSEKSFNNLLNLVEIYIESFFFYFFKRVCRPTFLRKLLFQVCVVCVGNWKKQSNWLRKEEWEKKVNNAWPVVVVVSWSMDFIFQFNLS